MNITPSASGFSLLFDLSRSASWDILKNSGACGNDIDGVRLVTFNGPANKGENFTITGITFGASVVPEPSVALLSVFAGLILMLRRPRI